MSTPQEAPGITQTQALHALAANIRTLEQNKIEAREEWDAICEDYQAGGGELTQKELKAIATAMAKEALAETVAFCDHVSQAASEIVA